MKAVDVHRITESGALLELLAQSVESQGRGVPVSSTAEVRRRAKLVLDHARRR